MTNTVTMVQNVKTALGDKQKMSRLSILDHGNPEGVLIGSDWISTENIESFVPLLASLRSSFAPGGLVHLQHCDAGQNEVLMIAFARAFGVPVYGGTWYHNPLIRTNYGSYVRADPDGTFHTDVKGFWSR